MEEAVIKLLPAARIIRAMKNDTLVKLKNWAIERLISLRYSSGAQLAVQRQANRKPDEFAQMDVYCEACKAAVKARIKEVTGREV